MAETSSFDFDVFKNVFHGALNDVFLIYSLTTFGNCSLSDAAGESECGEGESEAGEETRHREHGQILRKAKRLCEVDFLHATFQNIAQ